MRDRLAYLTAWMHASCSPQKEKEKKSGRKAGGKVAFCPPPTCIFPPARSEMGKRKMVQKRRLHHAVKTLHVFLSCSYEVPHSLAHLRAKMASARRRARIVDLDVSNRPSNLDLG